MLWGYVYLVLADGGPQGRYRVLIDTGSGLGQSNLHLEEGLKAASEQAGEVISLGDLTHILITHGHIDHFGGLTYIRPRSRAWLGVHELDLRILTHYEERLGVASRRLDEFLVEAGVKPENRASLIEMYRAPKNIFHSVQVDFTYESVGMKLGPFEILHVPGHCAGHVVIRLHDILFSGDHVLEHTSPHQSPERLTLSTGLDHYLKSLGALLPWAAGVRLTLGGHEGPITDLSSRVDAIRELHRERLNKVLELLQEPRTILQISYALFGEVQGYNALLALEEAGAHVEYLYQRGLLGIDNFAELVQGGGPVQIYYRRLS